MNNEGFTLLEMLMVVFIIAALLILTIPNITKHKEGVEETSCEAYASMVETQMVAYKLITENDATIEQLISGGYIPTNECADGRTVSINSDGKVVISG